MSRFDKSIRLKVEDILKNENEIMSELKSVFKGHKGISLNLWHNGINKTKLNDFSKKYADIINSIESNKSKKYNFQDYFVIQSTDEIYNNWKFKYIGNDIVEGINKLKELLKLTGSNTNENWNSGKSKVYRQKKNKRFHI
jgi:hypothetical protein